jgi:hypothetical protein
MTFETDEEGPNEAKREARRSVNWRHWSRWFIAEITVVVAGVLIALALNSWWQNRQQLQGEQRLLAALLDEFTSNQQRLAEIVAFHEDVKSTARTLIGISTTPGSTSADSADVLLANVTWWTSYTTLESTVLDAAVQDGRLGLIRTDSLRRLLTDWRSQVQSAGAQSTQEYSHYADVWLPLLRAGTDLVQIANSAKVVPGSLRPYQGTPFPPVALKVDHRPFVQTRAFRNSLVQKVWIEDDVLYQYSRLKPLAQRIVSTLKAQSHISDSDQSRKRE